MSGDVVKAAMARRINAMFAALRYVEWEGAPGGYQQVCPACGGVEPDHQRVNASGLGRDSVSEPCPIAFALSEEASNYGLPCPLIVERTFEDGASFLYRSIPGGTA